MLDHDTYVERFTEILKDNLIGMEEETESAYPALKKKSKRTGRGNSQTPGCAYRYRIKVKEFGRCIGKSRGIREKLKQELEKYEHIKNQPSKTLLLLHEQANAL